MKTYFPSRKFVYLIVFAFLLYASAALAQNEGIGTFSDLVGEALQASAQPQPSPIVTTTFRTNFAGETEAVTTIETPPFFSAPTAGFEYDYRRTQQKAPGGLAIDVNEAHNSFSFNLASTKFAFEYVHIWADGSNNLGHSQSVDSNGIKFTLTQPIGPYLIFSLPLFYRNDDGDAVTSTGPQTFGMDTFVMNPLMIFSLPLAIEKDDNGQAKPAIQQPLTLSVSSGYRVGVTQKNDIHPTSPDVDGWTGTVFLLAGVEYAPKKQDGEHKGDNKWKISGSATWNHLTNFYSSKAGPRPDDNGFGLGGTVVYNFITVKESDDKWHPILTLKIGYQYDGFNRDSYQHSVTIAGTYRFR
jgi:hypothetical protein